MGTLSLRIVTPTGAFGPYEVDSIRLTASDGSYGIRPGHTKALLALGAGPVAGLRAGQAVVQGTCGPGFATVEDDRVTAVVEAFGETT